MSPVGTAGSFGDELYGRLLPIAGDDPSDLLVWCNAKDAMIGDLPLISRDQPDGTPGWAILMSADTCPSKYLGWLAQFRGVTLDPTLDDASQRLRIKTTDGARRGSPGGIIGAAQQYLIGNRSVILRERWNPVAAAPDAYHYQVITYADQTPDAAAVATALAKQKPGGLILHYETATGQDWESLKTNWATWADVMSHFATWDAVRLDEPSS